MSSESPPPLPPRKRQINNKSPKIPSRTSEWYQQNIERVIKQKERQKRNRRRVSAEELESRLKQSMAPRRKTPKLWRPKLNRINYDTNLDNLKKNQSMNLSMNPRIDEPVNQ